MLDKIDGDIALVRSSACGGGSSGSRLVKPKDAGPSEEIGQLGIALLGDCSRISAKLRVVAD